METQYPEEEEASSMIGRLSSKTRQDGKWQGSYTNSSEFMPPPLSDSLLTDRQRVIAQLAGPAKGWIDNRRYGDAPYSDPLNYSAINQRRLAGDTMFPVPALTRITPGWSPLARARKGSHQWVGEMDDSFAYNENGAEATDELPDSYNMLNGYYPGRYVPSPWSAASHEGNHVNNMPTLGYSARSQQFANTAPGFSVNTYPGMLGHSDFNRTAEALQSLASRKRSVAAETGEVIKTPEEMASSLQQLHDRQDGRPLVSEEHRLGNYLRTSTRDYDNAERDVSQLIRNAGGPVMGNAMDKVLKSPRGEFIHPAINNISDTYREAIPDLVRNTPAEGNTAYKAAHILGLRFPASRM